ncbi:uncharacterized protein LOC121051268 [Rosa chinensis]|uniref:uncharacterized protein LOC121051268 n=1 Tax=Rosa chinensis TaxID=74649 RepID=UPI001AD91FCB|nr:uncharacterized protein LOC121051268 [Rosa chinensis]
MEFRSGVDDAWYAVKIYTEDNSAERLTVKFCNFEDEYDEVYEAQDLTSANHMTNFLSRFRLVSIQVQDSECPNVVEGMLVCAAVSVTPDNCRFYDAVGTGIEVWKEKKNAYASSFYSGNIGQRVEALRLKPSEISVESSLGRKK